MKRLFLTLLLVLWASVGWGADTIVYVNASMPDDTGNGLTAATAKKIINSGMAILRTAAPTTGHILYIASGIYSNAADHITIDDADLAGLSIVGAGRSNSIITPNGSTSFIVTVDSITVAIKNLTLLPSGTTRYGANIGNVSSTVINAENIDYVSPVGHDYYLLYNQGATYNDTRGRFFSTFAAGLRSPIRFINGAGGSFNYSMGMAAGFATSCFGPSFESTGTVNINDSIFLDAQSHGMQFTGAGVFNLINSIVSGGTRSNAAYSVYRTDGTLTVKNSLIIAPAWGGGKFISGTYTDGGGNLMTENNNPKFLSGRKKGWILPRIDDSGNFAYAQALAAILPTYGAKATFYSTGVDRSTFIDSADLRTMISDGYMEVGTHTYSHSDLSVTGKIFDISGGTVTVDRAGTGTITPSIGSPVVSFKTKTLAAIKAELETAGLTVTPTAIYSVAAAADKIRTVALGECIDAQEAGSTTINILVDNTAASGYFKAEMVDAKADLINFVGAIIDGQTGLPYACDSIGAPYNNSSADARLASIASGFLSFGSEIVGGAGTVADVTTVSNTDLYSVFPIGIDSGTIGIKGDGSEAVVRLNARALGLVVLQTGVVVSLLSHNTTAFTIEQWGWALDEWQKMGINVNSHQNYAAYLRSGLWTEGATGVFTRNYSINDGDYRISRDSDCVDAGAHVDALYGIPDYYGKYQYNKRNIGIDEGVDIPKKPQMLKIGN